MSIKIDGKSYRIGLALSGGGFRATAFHLGVFRKLQKMGILWKLDLLSCVSGGSIAGAYLAANWGDDAALDRLDKYLRSASIAVGSVVAGVLNPFESRLDKLAETYDRDLFKKKTLDKLDGGPRLYLNATNLATGNMFFFVTGEKKGAEMGEHELGQRPAGAFRLSRAVAASSAFPPVFPPLKLTKKEFNVPDVDYVTLTDGGVYDNLGANPLFREKRNALDYALISDAGKPFEIEDRPTEWGVDRAERGDQYHDGADPRAAVQATRAHARCEAKAEGHLVLDRQQGGRGAAWRCGVCLGGQDQSQEAERCGDGGTDEALGGAAYAPDRHVCAGVEEGEVDGIPPVVCGRQVNRSGRGGRRRKPARVAERRFGGVWQKRGTGRGLRVDGRGAASTAEPS